MFARGVTLWRVKEGLIHTEAVRLAMATEVSLFDVPAAVRLWCFATGNDSATLAYNAVGTV